MNKVLISIIIPVYNDENYLEFCLNSFLNQSLKDIEIICVNDGSTDNSLKILNEYANKDNRIKVISQSHLNAGAARNNGYKYAKGEYILFFDSDDYIEDNVLEILYNHAIQYDADITIAKSFSFNNNEYDNKKSINYTVIESSLPESNLFSINDIEDSIFKIFMGWAWDKLYKKSFIDSLDIKFQEINKHNDGYFVYTSLFKAKKISIIRERLFNHRKHIGSIETTQNSNYLCFYEMLFKIKKQLKEWNIYGKYELDFVKYSLAFTNITFNSLSFKNKLLLKKEINKYMFSELDITKNVSLLDLDEYLTFVKLHTNGLLKSLVLYSFLFIKNKGLIHLLRKITCRIANE